ncbi:MAG: hypothetical protein ACI8W7_001605 [Gammaproteobacteria bacterium]
MLRIYGIEGLRMAVAAVIAVITDGNINGPGMMVGECPTELLVGAAS